MSIKETIAPTRTYGQIAEELREAASPGEWHRHESRLGVVTHRGFRQVALGGDAISERDVDNARYIAFLHNIEGEVREVIRAAWENCKHEGGDDELLDALVRLDARARELVGEEEE